MPHKWRRLTFSSSSILVEWLENIRTRVSMLTQYIDSRTQSSASSIPSAVPSPDPVSSPLDQKQTPVYNMAAFIRPDRFIQSILQDYARRYFKDLLSCRIQVQVEVGKFMGVIVVWPILKDLSNLICKWVFETPPPPVRFFGDQVAHIFPTWPLIIRGPYADSGE